MTQEELITEIVRDSRVWKKEAKECLDVMRDVIIETLASGESVTIFNGLKIAVSDVSERTYVHPKTGEKVPGNAFYSYTPKLSRTIKEEIREITKKLEDSF